MALNKDSSGDVDFDSQNIFDDFSGSQEIGDEVKKIEETEKKDKFFYLKKYNTFSFVLNVILFLSIGVFSVYLFIQAQEEKREYAFLAPICNMFIGDITLDEENTCYGVKGVFGDYQKRFDDLMIDQAIQVTPLLREVYAIENFNLSPKISFLLKKSDSRLRPKEILVAFDELKNIFAPIDKKELRCYNINVLQGDILNITCDAFSSDWDTSIVQLSNSESIEPVDGGGTSISRASSFIHFIENHPDSKFEIISKPEAFSKVEVQEPPYTQKTTIHLVLKYNNVSNLSF